MDSESWPAVGTRLRITKAAGGSKYGAGADDGPREHNGTVERIFPRYVLVMLDQGYRLTIQRYMANSSERMNAIEKIHMRHRHKVQNCLYSRVAED